METHLTTTTPEPAMTFAEQVELCAAVRAAVAQSWALHPDWEADEHLSYLVNDAFVLDSEDQLLGERGGWGSPVQSVYPARTYVELWLRWPRQSFT